MPPPATDNRGLLEALLGDGRFLLALTGMALFASGCFAILQSLSSQLLPHDVLALGMDATALRLRTNPNLVHFMFHDRVAFGGTLLSIGTAYWWLSEFPLREGAAWAWWTLALSGAVGFLSFLAYLGYGYLDTWHGVATLLLLPVYLAGMFRSKRLLPPPLRPTDIWNASRKAESKAASAGRKLVFLSGLGLVVAGGTILVVGMTTVFVRQDVAFIGISPEGLRGISPVLVPLLAHDRTGFGGGLLTVGLILVMIMRHAPQTRSLAQLLLLMGLFGFGAALGVHFAIGYTDFLHLLPAYAGLLMFVTGEALFLRGLIRGRSFSATGLASR
jgi:hypothetical protein